MVKEILTPYALACIKNISTMNSNISVGLNRSFAIVKMPSLNMRIFRRSSTNDSIRFIWFITKLAYLIALVRFWLFDELTHAVLMIKMICSSNSLMESSGVRSS